MTRSGMKKVRALFASYPFVFQELGGLGLKMQRLAEALQGFGIEVTHFSPIKDKFIDYDLVHVFAAFHGNDRVVEWIIQSGVPAVLSAQLHPDTTAWTCRKADILDRILGRLTHWRFSTSYRQTQRALQAATHVIAESKREQELLIDGFQVSPQKISIIPNGVDQGFFRQDHAPFLSKYKSLEPFVLCVGSIEPRKNQLGLITAMRHAGLNIVLIGPARPYEAYFHDCMKAASSEVHYLGEISHDDPMLASAFAAASVFALPSLTESGPIVALEALAAGTPVVLTKHNGLDLPRVNDLWLEVNPTNQEEIRQAVLTMSKQPPSRERCSELVRPFTWMAAAEELRYIYTKIVTRH